MLEDEVRMVEELVDTLEERYNQAQEDGVDLDVPGKTAYFSDLRVMLNAAKTINEPETKRFLLILAGSFAAQDVKLFLSLKKFMNKATRDLMLLVTVIGNLDKLRGKSKDCDGDCDNCKDQPDLEKVECAGRA